MSFSATSTVDTQLKKHWVAGSVLSAVGSLIALYIVGSSMSDYSGSCTGPSIACGISDAFTIMLWTMLAFLFTGIILMRLLVSKRLSLAFYAFLFNAVIVLIVTDAAVSNINSLSSSSSSTFYFGLIASILSAIFLPIEIKIYAARLNNRSWVHGLPLALVQILFIAAVLLPVIKFYNDRHYQNEQLNKLESLQIQLYKPLGLVEGYTAGYAQTHQNETSGQPDYYEIQYYNSQGNGFSGPTPYNIYQLAAPTSYNPPDDCVSALPNGTNDYAATCRSIGQSKVGCSIFFAQAQTSDSVVTSSYGLCKINKTLIIIESTKGHLREEQVKFIFDNLSPESAKEALNYKTQ